MLKRVNEVGRSRRHDKNGGKGKKNGENSKKYGQTGQHSPSFCCIIQKEAGDFKEEIVNKFSLICDQTAKKRVCLTGGDGGRGRPQWACPKCPKSMFRFGENNLSGQSFSLFLSRRSTCFCFWRFFHSSSSAKNR